jgi:DNA modification methylase
MDTYDKDNTVTLHHGDARAFLKAIPDGDISLVVTSPPYNIGKSYERKQGITAYLEEQEQVIVHQYQ